LEVSKGNTIDVSNCKIIKSNDYSQGTLKDVLIDWTVKYMNDQGLEVRRNDK